MKKIIKYLFIVFAAIFVFLTIFAVYFFWGSATQAEEIKWGVDFSQMQAEYLKLNWKELYSSIIDLGVKNIKLHSQWDWVEGEKDDYYFSDIDWQLQRAKENNVKIIYVLGMKTGRWPECHLPDWAEGLSKNEQQEEILEYIREVVSRYKGNEAIVNWQVENEPLFKFGECPWYDEEFLKKEISLVRFLDPQRKIIISDSGEQSSWFKAARMADVVGVTMYRKVWVHVTNEIGFNIDYFFTPITYWRKASIINRVFDKEVLCIELQAEPWGGKPFIQMSLQEQYKTMNPQILKENIEFAKKTGLNTFYLWGVEWWYWLKEDQNQPQMWDEAGKLFVN